MDDARPSLPGFRRGAAILTAFSLIAMWIVAVSWWPDLPNQIPLHFDFSGHPNRFDDRSAWWVLPCIGTLIGGLMTSLGLWLPIRAGRPNSGFTVPEPELFNRLSSQARCSVVEPLGLALCFLGAFIVTSFTIMLNDIARVATHEVTLLPSWPLWVFLPVVLCTALFVSFGAKKRIHQAARSEGLIP